MADRSRAGLAWQLGDQMELHQFLVGADGAVIKRYAPQTESKEMAADIETALAA